MSLTHFNLPDQLNQREQQQLRRRLTALDYGVTPYLTIAGKTYLNFASNDYLGLAQHPAINQALQTSITQLEQMGSGSSHLVTGHHQAHDDLAKTLANATGYEAALTFSSGYMANIGAITALISKHDACFSDALNHASIIDGVRLTKSTIHRYSHQNHTELEEQLSREPALKKLIVTDHVFSMDGTVADVPRLIQLTEQYQAALMLDDAHGFGLPYQAKPQADIYMGTLGKAIGCYGAFVAGSQALIDYLITTARPYIYTTALPPALAQATQTAVDIAFSDKQRQQQLHANIEQLYTGLITQGWQMPVAAEQLTAILPIIVGSSTQALDLSAKLKAQGFWVTAIRPPTVPNGTARLRLCVSAAHRSEHITSLLAALQPLKAHV